MSCKCATWKPEDGRWSCSVSGDGCMFLIPNSKACAEMFGEGPDACRPEEMISEEEEEYKKFITESM